MGPSGQVMRVAGFWLRLLAGFVDGVALLLVGGCVFVLWARLLALHMPDFSGGWWDMLIQIPFQPDPFLLPGLGLAFLTGLALLYFETAYWHSTVGQRLFGLTVVQPDGRPVGWARALVRTLVLGLSTGYLFLGVVWIGFDRLRQGWHDKVAGTYVVHSSGPRRSILQFVRQSVTSSDS